MCRDMGSGASNARGDGRVWYTRSPLRRTRRTCTYSTRVCGCCKAVRLVESTELRLGRTVDRACRVVQVSGYGSRGTRPDCSLLRCLPYPRFGFDLVLSHEPSAIHSDEPGQPARTSGRTRHAATTHDTAHRTSTILPLRLKIEPMPFSVCTYTV